MTNDPTPHAEAPADGVPVPHDEASAKRRPEPVGDREGQSAGPPQRPVRQQLSDLHRENDRLRAQVERWQRSRVEEVAAADLVAPGDLWLLREEVRLADLLGEDGEVDEARVRDLLARVLADHPHWRRQRRSPNGDQGARAGQDEQTGVSMARMLRGR